MSTTLPAVVEPADSALIAQADTDRQFVATWLALHDSVHTRRGYERRARHFIAFVDKPLADVRVGDVQAYLGNLHNLASTTRATATATIKSLFSLVQDLGYIRYNVAKPIEGPPIKNGLAERTMGEGDAMRMITLEPDVALT